MNKRKLLTLAMSLCVLAIVAIGGTLAYFTDTEAKTNSFVVGDLDVVLNEVFDEKTPLVPTSDYKEVNVEKKVTIENKGNVPAYVRLLIAYEDTKDVGAMAYLGFNDPYCPNGPVKVDQEDRYVIPGGSGDWLQIKRDEDGTVFTVGYVTLSTAVESGEETDAILNALAIKADADNAWSEIVGANYDVLVLAQAAQEIDGQGATKSINDAFGFELNAQADVEVAKLFTDAKQGTFTAYTYTSEGAWNKQANAWNAYENDPTPRDDQI